MEVCAMATINVCAYVCTQALVCIGMSFKHTVRLA